MDAKNKALKALVADISGMITDIAPDADTDVEILAGSLAIVVTARHTFVDWVEEAEHMINKYGWNEADVQTLTEALVAKVEEN